MGRSATKKKKRLIGKNRKKKTGGLFQDTTQEFAWGCSKEEKRTNLPAVRSPNSIPPLQQQHASGHDSETVSSTFHCHDAVYYDPC